MANLPITHMTLYKHGVGYFERKARVEGEQVEFSFRADEMNDILKSLTVIDSGEGQVLGLDYATPREREELLQGCSIDLADGTSLRDLLSGLRGCQIRLQLKLDEHLTGELVGWDRPSKDQPVAETLVSILQDDSREVRIVGLGDIQGVEIIDERGEKDLRFFLGTVREQENHRNVTIRLTPGEHNLLISYVAPAPLWRVSYRIVLDSGGDGPEQRALLMGWGIFDNLLEENLEKVSLSLVAGMPISFVYDLATPFTPRRPTVKEEARVAAAPVQFEDALHEDLELMDPDQVSVAMAGGVAEDLDYDLESAALESDGLADLKSARAVKRSFAPAVEGKSMDELFEYRVQSPVSVGRGQSAMVPVISSQLEYRKDLIYNAAKMARHPVATLRLENETGLTIERGPVTVLDQGEYVGEAVMPFTREEGEMVVPYAVELGVKVSKESAHRTEINALGFKDLYLLIEEWAISTLEYRVSNSTAKKVKVLVEHLRNGGYELFETFDPVEKTENFYRFEVDVESRSETILAVQERMLGRRREKLQTLSQDSIEKYFNKSLMDHQNRKKVFQVLETFKKISEQQSHLKDLETQKKDIYKSQKQIQGNMAPLSQTGEEGELRSQYLQKLKSSEDKLDKIEKQSEELKTNLKQSEQEAKLKLKELEQSMPI